MVFGGIVGIKVVRRLSWGSGQFNLPKLASLLVTSTISKYKKLICLVTFTFDILMSFQNDFIFDI